MMAWASGDDLTSANLNYRGGNDYNVLDPAYAADATGASDSAAAIQAAIDAAIAAGGGVVAVPPGTYRLDSTLSFGGNIIFRGSGVSSTKFDASNLGATEDAFHLGTAGPTNKDFHLSDFEIDMGDAGQDAIRIFGGDRFSLARIKITDAGRHGINSSMTASNRWMETYHFSDIEIRGSGTDGIYYSIASGLGTNAFINQGTWNNVEVRDSGEHEVHWVMDGDTTAQKVSGLVCINGQFDALGNATHAVDGWLIERTAGQAGKVESVILLGTTIENTGAPNLAGSAFSIADPGVVASVTAMEFIGTAGFDTAVDFVSNSSTAVVRQASSTAPFTVSSNLSLGGSLGVGGQPAPAGGIDALVIGGSTSSSIKMRSTGGGGIFLWPETNDANPVWKLQTNASESIVLAPGNTSRHTLNASSGEVDFGANVGVNTGNPTAQLHVSGATIRIATDAGAIAGTDAGNAGDIMWGVDSDTSYLYVCTSANSWMRATLNPF